MLANGLLLLVAVWTIWNPAETVPVTPVVIAATCVVMTRWGLRRTGGKQATSWIATAALLAVLVAAVTLAGWDRARAVQQLGLVCAVAVLLWLASRRCPPRRFLLLLAFAISLLALLGLWQVSFGFEQARQALVELPAEARDVYAQRLALGRAFATLPVPGHLAILLATALPLLLPLRRPGGAACEQAGGTGADPQGDPSPQQKLRGDWAVSPLLRWTGCGLCVLGLVLTHSLLGTGLAGCGCVAVLCCRRRVPVRAAVVVGLALAASLALVAALRSDLRQLEPVRLRADNWHTALWVWSSSPVSGVGLGGFGQASQAVPFPVGNRPVHAHSLPLELLADLGLVGLGLFLVAVISLAGLVRRLWSRDPALATAITLIPLHNLADFSCYVSGVAVPWAVLAGWSLAVVRGPRADEPAAAGNAAGHRGSWLLFSAVLVALLATTAHAVSSWLERSAVSRDTPPVAQVRLATLVAPWRIAPIELLAVTALESRRQPDLDLASQAVRQGRWLRPYSASLATLEGRLALVSGRVASGIAATWSASRLQPGNERYSQSLETVLGWLQADDATSQSDR